MTLGGVVFGKLLNLVAVENSGARRRLRAFTTTSEQGVPSATTYIQYYSTAVAERNPQLESVFCVWFFCVEIRVEGGAQRGWCSAGYGGI